MGVRWYRRVGFGDEEASCHAEMNQELSWAVGIAGEIGDDGLADTVDAVDARVGEYVGYLGRW